MIRRSPRTGLPLIPKTLPQRSTRCRDVPPAELIAGIAQFNVGEYWHCHETLEALWRSEPDPIRFLYQGILLIGVGFYHLQRGNARGALVKLRQGVACLEPFRPACMGIAVEELFKFAHGTIQGLSDGRPPFPEPTDEGSLPLIRLVATDGP
ncbi:MAG: DUF309 domain-containing protein [Chloroflexota bacterium]